MPDQAKTVEAEAADTIVVPLHEERVRIERRTVPRARVRVRTHTTQRAEQIDEQLTHERVEVTRVPVGRQVDAVPPVREEDGVTIVPVVEEVLVVERRLMLREEVHIRRMRVIEQHREKVMVRSQHATVERLPSEIEPFKTTSV